VGRRLQGSRTWVGLALLLSLALAAWLAKEDGRTTLLFALVTAAAFILWSLGLARVWRAVRRRRYLHLASLVVLAAGMGLYLWLSLWALRPAVLPQRTDYDFIANLQVTERLVDPDLLKAERWEIMGQEREVLFVHPTSSGSTALVYPVRVRPRTALRAHLAVAPEAWTKEGDGVTFSVYVEDEAGMHLVYGRYVDPKHHEQDRRWLPLRVDLSPFSGKLVRDMPASRGGVRQENRTQIKPEIRADFRR
jgi:hypothetical protein